MKKTHFYNALLVWVVMLCMPLTTVAQTELQNKFKEISNITEVKNLESGEFAEKYVTYFTQPIDHENPELGTFRQRVIVSHVGFDRPTVLVTEGYGGTYGMNPRYREE
jgi:hypothetical protein